MDGVQPRSCQFVPGRSSLSCRYMKRSLHVGDAFCKAGTIFPTILHDAATAKVPTIPAPVLYAFESQHGIIHVAQPPSTVFSGTHRDRPEQTQPGAAVLHSNFRSETPLKRRREQ